MEIWGTPVNHEINWKSSFIFLNHQKVYNNLYDAHKYTHDIQQTYRQTLGAASKLNRRLTGGSARFWAVAIV